MEGRPGAAVGSARMISVLVPGQGRVDHGVISWLGLKWIHSSVEGLLTHVFLRTLSLHIEKFAIYS